MSVNVLVIPEDPTLNGYILRPLVRMILADVGKPNANVTVLPNPRLRGYDEAVRVVRNELSKRYSHMDLWLFFPDADRAMKEHGDPRRPGSGRGAMTEKSIAQRRRFFQLCPEIAELRNRIEELLDG